MMDASALDFGRAVFDVLFLTSFRAAALILPAWLALLLIPTPASTGTRGLDGRVRRDAAVAGGGLGETFSGTLVKFDGRNGDSCRGGLGVFRGGSS